MATPTRFHIVARDGKKQATVTTVFRLAEALGEEPAKLIGEVQAEPADEGKDIVTRLNGLPGYQRSGTSADLKTRAENTGFWLSCWV